MLVVIGLISSSVSTYGDVVDAEVIYDYGGAWVGAPRASVSSPWQHWRNGRCDLGPQQTGQCMVSVEGCYIFILIECMMN